MPRKSKEQRLKEIHDEAMQVFDDIWSSVKDVRRRCMQARRFYSIPGEQWAMWNAMADDEEPSSPQFELNKVHKAVIRIFSEYRNNRITVDFRPGDDDANQETADTCDGLYRADEVESTGQEAYDNAFEEGVGGGMGAWRYRAVEEDEEDDENDRQRIAIEPIFDADASVFFDLDAKRQDKADATLCFVLQSMTVRGYEAKWPDHPVVSFDMVSIGERAFTWCTGTNPGDIVFFAELYKVTTRSGLRHVFRNDLTDEEEQLTDAEFKDVDHVAEMEALGFRRIREEKRKERRVDKYVLNGQSVMEDCGRIAGKCIPVVPFYGKRWYVDSVEQCMGEVELSKDAQRLLNMQVSRLAEVAGTTPFEVPILTTEQVQGHEESWAAGNLLRHPYRLINPIKDATGGKMPPSQPPTLKPPDLPPALATLVEISANAIDDLTGNPQAATELVANVSGDAVTQVQQRLDMQNFLYHSNMAKAMTRGGQIWLSMAKELYAEDGRQLETLDEEYKNPKFVKLKQPKVLEGGKQALINDLSKGKYKVWVDVGPSFTSRRDRVVKSCANLAQATQDPDLQKVLTLTAIMNMDGEGIDDIRVWSRKKLLAMGAAKPTPEERAEMEEEAANTPPDPNAAYLQAQAVLAQADTLKRGAETRKTLADEQLIIAKTTEIGAKLDGSHPDTQMAQHGEQRADLQFQHGAQQSERSQALAEKQAERETRQ